jgi:hypothetical protein
MIGSPEQGITTFSINIKPGAARDKYTLLLALDIKKALEQAFPVWKFVDFVQHNYGSRARPVERQNSFSMLRVIPV